MPMMGQGRRWGDAWGLCSLSTFSEPWLPAPRFREENEDGYHFGGSDMLFSLYSEFLVFSLESFLPIGYLGGTLAEGRESWTRWMPFFHSLHTLDSTKKVSDVLKLFEDGEMAEFLQGDVSGSWEILSLTNSSQHCFCYSIGISNFQGLFWAYPLLSSLEIPQSPLLLLLLL